MSMSEILNESIKCFIIEINFCEILRLKIAIYDFEEMIYSNI